MDLVRFGIPVSCWFMLVHVGFCLFLCGFLLVWSTFGVPFVFFGHETLDTGFGQPRIPRKGTMTMVQYGVFINSLASKSVAAYPPP